MLLLSSASSKTTYGTAFQLAQRTGIEVVGLTYAVNLEFCNGLGCYHQFLTYDQLGRIAAEAAIVFVDFAVRAVLRKVIHTRFDHLKYSCSVGSTHVGQLGGAKDLPGPRATLYFAPAQIKKRTAEWGTQGLGQHLPHAWQAFIAKACNPAAPWLAVQHRAGPDAVMAAYASVLGGSRRPTDRPDPLPGTDLARLILHVSLRTRYTLPRAGKRAYASERKRMQAWHILVRQASAPADLFR